MFYPKEILILRHAEKPKDHDNKNLSTKGYERAAALAYYMPDAFGEINHIYAAGVGHKSHSKRPMETITPLAERLDKKIHHKYLKYEYPEMVQHILNEASYENETIVIAWQHTDIEDIAKAFGAIDVPTDPWPEDCFDLVWKLSYNGNKGYVITQIPQLLLYGDTDKTIGSKSEPTFCEQLQSISGEKLCGTQPLHPIGNFPGQAMTCVFEIPKDKVAKGLSQQYIFVGAGYLLNEEAVINNQIAGILNTAYDFNDSPDLQIPFSSEEEDKRPKLPFELGNNEKYYISQLAKVDLMDGNENDMMTLVSGLYLADQLLNFPTPEKQKEDGLVNFYAQGNLLVHCYDGGSRSVTMAALYIYYKFFVGTETTFQDIYTQIICRRWNLAPNHHPSQGICETAYQILSTYKALFPEPVYK